MRCKVKCISRDDLYILEDRKPRSYVIRNDREYTISFKHKRLDSKLGEKARIVVPETAEKQTTRAQGCGRGVGWLHGPTF